MFKKKNKQIKTSPNKSNLDQVLWFIENYLPQKKDGGVKKKLYMDNLEAETIKIFSKLASTRSKTLLPTTKNKQSLYSATNFAPNTLFWATAFALPPVFAVTKLIQALAFWLLS